MTSPEELIAAAHSACFAMQFSALLGGAGGSNPSLEVSADVTLGPDPAGGFRISGIKLTVSGSAEGVSAEDFARIAGEAKAACPVSKALAGHGDHARRDVTRSGHRPRPCLRPPAGSFVTLANRG